MKKILVSLVVIGVIAAAIMAARNYLNASQENIAKHDNSVGMIEASNQDKPGEGVAELLDEKPTSKSMTLAGLGGEGLKLQSALQAAVAMKGRHDRAVISMVTMSQLACAEEYPEEAKADPNRRWAIEYIASACEGFNAQSFAVKFDERDPNTDLVAIRVGEKAALEKAREELKLNDNYLDLGRAGWYLIERNSLPNQAAYGLNKEKLAQVFVHAAQLRTCDALNACGAHSLFTAQICAVNGCPEGTTYIQAIRSILPLKEYEAALKLRTSLAAQ